LSSNFAVLQQLEGRSCITATMATSSLSLWLIYGLVVLYALCYQFQRPIEPFLVDRLVKGGGQDATLALGRVEFCMSFAQWIGSLIMGYILDKFGVKTGLILNFAACAMQYYILSITDSLNMLLLSKLPGMMMAGFLCAQTAVGRLTPEGEERSNALGRLTTAYTIGGVFGPSLGGLLGSTGDYFLGAKLASAGSLVALGLVCLLPNPTSDVTVQDKAEDDSEKKKENRNVPESWLARVFILLPLVGPLLATKVVTGIANNMARTAQPIILKNMLQFDEAQMGFLMSGQFLFGGFVSALPLTRALGGTTDAVIRKCIIAMTSLHMLEALIFSPFVGALEMSSTLTGIVFVAFALTLALFQYPLATNVTATAQRLAGKEMVGTETGIEHSIFAVAGMLGPLGGTAIFQAYGLSGICLACAACFFCTLAFLSVATKSKHA